MHPDVKALRRLIGSVPGAWVRRWVDGELWVGIPPAPLSDKMEIARLVNSSPDWRTVGVAGPNSWIVERR